MWSFKRRHLVYSCCSSSTKIAVPFRQFVVCSPAFSFFFSAGGACFSFCLAGVDVWWTPQPSVVSALKDTPVTFCSCGLNHSGAVDVTGRLWMWGSNADGQVSLRTRLVVHEQPMLCFTDVRSVSLAVPLCPVWRGIGLCSMLLQRDGSTAGRWAMGHRCRPM